MMNTPVSFFRYFGVTVAQLGVLTNGLVYQFYTDLKEQNVMDEEPFLELNLLDVQVFLVDELKKFTKAEFDTGNIRSTAKKIKYTLEIKRRLTAEYESPSPDFVGFWIDAVKAGRKTPRIIEEFKPITKDAFQQFVDAPD